MPYNRSNAFAVITNHFKEKGVIPKIVYANNVLLHSIGYSLDEISGKDPVTLFTNWYRDHFIEQIVACVDEGASWSGTMVMTHKSGKKFDLDFVITPIYNIDGSINYYICSASVDCDESVCTPELDNYISSMWQYYDHFVGVYKGTPANLVRIDRAGKVTFITELGKKHLGIDLGDDFFKNLKNGTDTEEEIHLRSSLGKVSKINFTTKNKDLSFKGKFWPIADSNHSIIGYAITFADVTERVKITKKLLELKGA